MVNKVENQQYNGNESIREINDAEDWLWTLQHRISLLFAEAWKIMEDKKISSIDDISVDKMLSNTISEQEFKELVIKLKIPSDKFTYDSFKSYYSQYIKSVKEKYWLAWNEQMKLTRKDLEEFSQEFTKPNLNAESIVKKLYEEVIETKVDKEWVKAVSIENATQWINSDRLTKAKDTINNALDKKLEAYDFLWDRKEMFKLTIINKILYNPISQKITNYLESITKLFENPKELFISPDKTTHISNKEWNDLSLSVEGIIKPYFDLFDQIKLKLWSYEIWHKSMIYLTQEQKWNLISQIDFFNNPNIMQWNVDSKAILSQFDELLKNPENFNSPKELTEEDKKKLVDYMMKSRWGLEKALITLQSWDKTRDFALSIWDNKYVKWFLEILFKIPILWKILAIFLWLDPNKPLEDFNEQTKTFKTLKWLKNLWASKDKNWNLMDNIFDSPLKKLDLSEINHSESRNEIKQINDFKNSITVPVETPQPDTTKTQAENKESKPTQTMKLKYQKDEDFWKDAFSIDWVEKDWVKLKFDISEAQKTDWKISTEEFKEIVNKWFSDYKEKSSKKVEEDKKSIEQKTEDDRKLADESQKKAKLEEAKTDNDKIDKVMKFINELRVEEKSKLGSITIDNINKWVDAALYGANFDKEKAKLLFDYIKEFVDKKTWFDSFKIDDFIKDWSDFKEWLNTKKIKNNKIIDPTTQQVDTTSHKTDTKSFE